MTRILAVETATPATDVAVLEDGRLRAEARVDDEQPHAAVLLPSVERALAAADLDLGAIDAFAVSIGPGSFTGLRIGLATVKAFALGTDKLVAPVPTLAALAWGAREPGVAIVACLDARRGELYAAGYRAEGDGLAPCLGESVWRPEELAARIHGPCLLVGDVPDGLRRALEAADRGAVRLAPAAQSAPRARAVAVLGARMLARGEGVAAREPVPRYLRRAEAEARRLRQPLEPGRPAGGIL